MSGLDNIDRTCSGDDGNTKTEDKSPPLQLANNAGIVKCGTVDDTPKNDKPAADVHTDPSTPGINGRSDKGQCADATNLVHGSVDGLPLSVNRSIEEVEELLVRS